MLDLAWLVPALSGCAVPYLAQSVAGHLEVVRQARPVDDWLADPATPTALRERLQLVARMRDFAVRELKLPDNASYRRYADLGRPAVVWNVVAAPSLSLTLKTWCYPVMGCAGYRGYFDREAAQAQARALEAEGWDVHVYPVPAYSTLGWTDWLGGDPLLNTFIHRPEGELARMLFHEMAHQRVYVPNDTAFSESYATAVERLGVQRWLDGADAQVSVQFAAHEARRADVRALVAPVKQALQSVYDSGLPDAAKRQRKAEILTRLREDHRRLRDARWDGHAGWDPWFARVNNAMLGVQAAYHDGVPAFERLFEAEGRDFERFHARVQAWAARPPAERQAFLRGADPSNLPRETAHARPAHPP